jgi:hypothetical protein
VALVALAVQTVTTTPVVRTVVALGKPVLATLAPVQLALFVLFGPAQLARSHRQTQAICKGRI